MQNYYYLQSMMNENFSTDIIEPLVQVGRGYFDTIVRKIIYVNINQPSIYENLSKSITKTIADKLNVGVEQLLMIFGQKFCMNNFFNIYYIENEIQQMLKQQNDKFIKLKRGKVSRNMPNVRQDDSYSYFSIQLSEAQLSAYEISSESNQILNQNHQNKTQESQIQQYLEQCQISYTNWDQSRFMQDKKWNFIKKYSNNAHKTSSEIKMEENILKAIKTNQDIQVPSFLRFNFIKDIKNQFSFDPQIQKKNEILTYIESVLIPKTQLSLFCQHMKIAYPIYNRIVKDKVFYINAKIILNNLTTKFVQKQYQGNGMAANLKMAQNQTSIQLLTKVWLQYPQIWKQFINRNKGKKFSYN